MSKRKQQGLDWNRGAQLRALNEYPFPKRLRGYGRPVSRATAASVLRMIDDHQREKEEAWPSLETMAACVRLSTKTVQRAIDALRSIGLVTVWNETTKRGHPLLKVAINWDVVFGCRPEPKPKRARRPGARKKNRSATHRPGARSTKNPEDTVAQPEDIETDPEDTVSLAPYKNRPENRTREASPPSPPKVSSASAASWEEVEEELYRRGVQAYDAAIRSASRFVDADHVLAIIAAFDQLRTPSWRPGALFVRVQKARTWLEPTDGWVNGEQQQLDFDREQQLAIERQQRERVESLSDSEFREIVRCNETLQSMARMYHSLADLRRDATAQKIVIQELSRRQETLQ
ncbi:hypothetical protein KOR42_41790 [Thalassoglobus neptunius]|uniref:Helix-turn-helix domain-containing protein n=1 Tax=Thalassoglobus neptunius TaxID=1938619 RepID=A0A5C5W995_9PLAN|nr:helix-turn-helix domain-containing protein [Thalassoglobus neptunius]TWT47067.1 hypothetical protein KOR42_41790 [Thalassoglobus neptunius]